MKNFIRKYSVPLLFLVLCLLGIALAQKPLPFVINTILERMGRNCFMVISLLIPVMAGIGLNFSIVVGAMAAQIALIFITDWQVSGTAGVFLALALSTIPAILFGYGVGALFNRAKGKEMVTGIITGFFANGLYQLIFLFGAGTVFTVFTKEMLLPRGVDEEGVPKLMGFRNTIDLERIQYSLDDLIVLPDVFGAIHIPLFTLLMIALGCTFVWLFQKTKLGQEMKAMGFNRHLAEVSGINVNRNRLIATIISTVMAAWGQIIFLQNMGTINTYSSHEQVGMFAIAALLVAGASVSSATIFHALLGTLLFQTLFFTSPLAGEAIFGSALLGEYFRVFIAYGVIAAALALHAWRQKKF
jgi:simple sugar transport system permease protein